MDDVGFMALAERAISYVDERWGRPFAWAVAVAVIVLPIGVVTLVLLQ